jgi:hypothetical protein
MIDSNQHPHSDRCPMTSLSRITVRFKGIFKSASFPNSQILDLQKALGITELQDM